jgi:recombination DNA repair RAD52 pathway protein
VSTVDSVELTDTVDINDTDTDPLSTVDSIHVIDVASTTLPDIATASVVASDAEMFALAPAGATNPDIEVISAVASAVDNDPAIRKEELIELVSDVDSVKDTVADISDTKNIELVSWAVSTLDNDPVMLVGVVAATVK